MRKFLLFCVLFGSLRLSSQSINIAEHGNDKITYAIENILTINAKCIYFIKLETEKGTVIKKVVNE